MFNEDQMLPISALQHLLFCERQCALIHIEQLWVENRLTVEGRHLHDKAHGQPGPRGGGLIEARPGVRISRGVRLRSFRLGLFGVADVVEFHSSESDHQATNAGQYPPNRGTQARDPPIPLPVEYKRGRPKKGDYDRVQLCAQAMCLEEMLHVPVPNGAIFYGRTRRREVVAIDPALRLRTEQAAVRLHELIASGRTPRAAYETKCKRCSLLTLCMPNAAGCGRSAVRFVTRALASLSEDANSALPPDRMEDHAP